MTANAFKDAQRVQYNAAGTPDPGLVTDMTRMLAAAAAAAGSNGNVSWKGSGFCAPWTGPAEWQKRPEEVMRGGGRICTI